MSSSRSRNRSRAWLGPRRTAGAAGAFLLLALIWATPRPAWAGYDVKVTWLDEAGSEVVSEGTDAAYVFERRTYYRNRREDGSPPFRDEEVARDRFPFTSRGISFRSIRSVVFQRRPSEQGERLMLTFEMTTGETVTLPGAELEGSAHPDSPRLRFQGTSGTISLPIDPLTPSTRLAGRTVLVRIEFPGNPDRRRPPRK